MQGPNLGGWLVLEPWITPSLFYQFLSEQYEQYAGHLATSIEHGHRGPESPHHLLAVTAVATAMGLGLTGCDSDGGVQGMVGMHFQLSEGMLVMIVVLVSALFLAAIVYGRRRNCDTEAGESGSDSDEHDVCASLPGPLITRPADFTLLRAVLNVPASWPAGLLPK